MKKILVTGVSGFVGKAIVDFLSQNSNFKVYGASRKLQGACSPLVSWRQMPEMDESDQDYSSLVESVDCIIHAAGLAHVLDARKARNEQLFYRVNRDATLALARQAIAQGVSRFIFLSSIGVNGTQSTVPFDEESPANPLNAYARSKYEAEQGLLKLAKISNMEVVIIRPPLIFGLGAPGNFERLLRVVSKGVPVPLGAIKNKRTLIGIDNLCDFIGQCILHPNAGNQLFLVGEREDISTPELIRDLSISGGKSAVLIWVPVWLMRFTAGLLGKSKAFDQLCGSLQVDISKAKKLLGWEPKTGLKEGLKKVYR